MLNSVINTALTAESFLICTAASIVLGILGALVYMYKNDYSRGVALTLTILPATVQLIIMLINGNIGTGVAVAGAFSLIRFRSAPGGARDIVSLFTCVAIGIATGMGYVFIAAAFFVIISLLTVLLVTLRFGEKGGNERELRITIPENMQYDELFDDLFKKYTKRCELIQVKTTNMGTLFELRYRVLLREAGISKQFIDEIRCRNGNLTVQCARIQNSDML